MERPLSLLSCVFFGIVVSRSGRDQRSGLRYDYTIVADHGNSKSECIGTGYVDGESFVGFFNGSTHKQVSWLPDGELAKEQTEFTKRCADLEKEMTKLNVSTLSGVKTLRLDSGCRPSYSRKSKHTTPESVRECIARLHSYRSLVAGAAKSPKLEIERRHVYKQGVRLRCVARNFYPSDLDLQWWREYGGRMVKTSFTKYESLPSGDGLYQKYIDVMVLDSSEDDYVCQARGTATKHKTESLRLINANNGDSDSGVLAALFMPMCMIAASCVLIFWMKRRNISRLRRVRRRSCSTATQRSSYRVNRHADLPYDLPTAIWVRDKDVAFVDIDNGDALIDFSGPLDEVFTDEDGYGNQQQEIEEAVS